MAKRVTLDNLPDAIADILEEYGEDTIKATHEVVKKVAKAGAKEVNASASGTFKGENYKSSWTSKSMNTRLGAEAVIYSNMPGLPHLLEKGHAKRGGGRVNGRVHIAPTAARIGKELIAGLEVTL